MTNEQAVETARRAKSTCKFAIADCAKTLLHYCKGDKGIEHMLQSLEIQTNDVLDHQAREVFAANIQAEC